MKLVLAWLSVPLLLLVSAAACDGDGGAGTPDGGPDGGSSGGSSGTGTGDGGVVPGIPTAIDPTCGGTGRAVFPMGVENSVDELRSVSRRADGTTVVVGTIDEPTPVESIQSAFWASMRLRDDCTIDTGYASAGVGFFTLSEPDYQVQDVHRVRSNADGTSTLVGASTQQWTHPDKETSWQVGALTAVQIDSNGSRVAAFGTPFTHYAPEASSPYPMNLVVRGLGAGLDGTVRALAQASEQVLVTALRADNTWSPTPLVFFDDGGDVEGLGYDIHRVDGLAVLADGSMLIGGWYPGKNGRTGQAPGVLHVLASGAIDTAFGAAGVGGVGEAGSGENPVQLAVQPDGKILLASTMVRPDRYQTLGITRLNADGTVDLTFGTSGVTTVDLGEGIHPSTSNVHELGALVLNSDGSILLGGTTYALDGESGAPQKTWHIGVVRLTASGLVDPAFANRGVFNALQMAGGLEEHLRSLDQSADGVVTIGATGVVSQDNSDWVVYRLRPQL